MLTRTLIALTSIASVAAIAPAAVAIDQALGGAQSSPASAQANPWQAGTNVPKPNSGSSTSTAAPDTGGSQVGPQTAGVVMIDTVLPGGEGAGTGMVLTPDGTVLTNYHVVEGSTQIRATVPGGKSYTAKVIGHDQTHDVAVLKLQDASDMKTVKLDKDGVRVGQQVTAVGQGGGQNVLYSASGAVTALNQSITASDESSLSVSEDLTGLIEVNAAIVPGYSGGPLFDSQGEVVGIDTAAAASNSQSPFGNGSDNPFGADPFGNGSGSSNGSGNGSSDGNGSSNGNIAAAQGYAIPIDNAMSIVNPILKGTKTATNHIGPRSALGIQVLPSGPSRGGSSALQGVAVQGVVAGDAAARIGISRGDVITGIGGKRINNTKTLSEVMNKYYPGQQVTVTWTDTAGRSHSASLRLETSTAN